MGKGLSALLCSAHCCSALSFLDSFLRRAHMRAAAAAAASRAPSSRGGAVAARTVVAHQHCPSVTSSLTTRPVPHRQLLLLLRGRASTIARAASTTPTATPTTTVWVCGAAADGQLGLSAAALRAARLDAVAHHHYQDQRPLGGSSSSTDDYISGAWEPPAALCVPTPVFLA